MNYNHNQQLNDNNNRNDFIHITCLGVTFAVFHRLHLESDCRRHQAQSIALVLRTFHDFPDTNRKWKINFTFSKQNVKQQLQIP